VGYHPNQPSARDLAERSIHGASRPSPISDVPRKPVFARRREFVNCSQS